MVFDSKCEITCTFGPVVMLISRAKSTFSFASMFNAFFVSPTELFTVRSATARFFDNDGDVNDCLRSVDVRRLGEADVVFAFVEFCRDGVPMTLLSDNGTFDILLMPSFLLRSCALFRNL